MREPSKPTKRTRQAIGDHVDVKLRLPQQLIEAIDAWAKRASAASRSDAICRLIEKSLASVQPPDTGAHPGASRARELAGQEIDKLANPSATEEEQKTRKRRLTRGPNEFRELRGDQPKRKG
jgi:hypothetical protein